MASSSLCKKKTRQVIHQKTVTCICRSASVFQNSVLLGMSWNLRNVNFVLQTYQKDESGIYRVIDENTDAHQQPYYKCAGDVEWGGSLLLRYKVLGTQMKNESGDPVVFAIVPYLRGTNTAIQQDLTKISACEFSAQISGTVLGTGSESSRGYEDYTVNGFQMTTAEDPLDDTAQWSELNGTGPIRVFHAGSYSFYRK